MNNKILKALIIPSVISGALLISHSASAGKIINLDAEPRTISITHVGNVTETKVIAPNAFLFISGPWLELSTPAQSFKMPAEGSNDYVIKDNKVQIHRIRDNERGGF
jgi:hypothetical protein